MNPDEKRLHRKLDVIIGLLGDLVGIPPDEEILPELAGRRSNSPLDNHNSESWAIRLNGLGDPQYLLIGEDRVGIWVADVRAASVFDRSIVLDYIDDPTTMEPIPIDDMMEAETSDDV